MEKLRFPKLKISFETNYKLFPIKIEINGIIRELPKGKFDFYYDIQSINDIVKFKFTNFVPQDISQEVVIDIFHNEQIKDIVSLSVLQMMDNKYVKNTRLETNIIKFNGVFELNFFKEWFECNILNGSQILSDQNSPSQCIIGYDNKNLRVDLSKKDFDIVCLGCSITYGYELPVEDSWPYILGEKTNLTVANFGTTGAGIDTIFKQYTYVKRNINAKEIYILLPNFYRKRIKFYFGDVLCEHLYTVFSTSSNFLGKQFREKINKEILEYSVKRGKKIIDFLEAQKNVKLTSWDDEVYDTLSEKQRLPKYLYDNKITSKRTKDGHPVKEHNEYFAESLCKHRQHHNHVL